MVFKIKNIQYIEQPFLGTNKKFNYLYKIVNNINNKYYYGVHSCNTLIGDYYSGSGKILKKALKKYGPEHFTKYIIKFYNTQEELFLGEKEILSTTVLNDINCYNISSGGKGGRNGIVIVLNEDGTKSIVTKEEYKNNNLKSINIGEGNPNYGNKLSDETKNKISNSIREFYKKNRHRQKTEFEKQEHSRKLLGRFSVSKENVTKYVKLEEAINLISDGWSINDKRKYYINNGSESIKVTRFEHNTKYKDWNKGFFREEKIKIKKETYKDIANRTGYCVDTVRKYIKKYGIINEEIIKQEKELNKKYTGTKYYYNNEYLTLTQISKKYNINYSLLKSRVKLGWSIQECFDIDNTKHRKKNSKLYMYNNKYYSISELSEEYNVPLSMLYQRINSGMDIDSALKTQSKRIPKRYLYNGQYYSVREISEHFNKKLSTVKQRLKNNWDINDVIER